MSSTCRFSRGLQAASLMERMTMRIVSLALLLGFASANPAAAAEPAVRFDKPTTAIISARHWDQTQQQWEKKPEGLYFDAVHRFLLVRFPGCAEQIRKKLADGYQIGSAKLRLKWVKQEWMRIGGGYQSRTWPLKDKEPAKWHAQVWALRRPWTADPKIGPTWNAYINGSGYWRAGGGMNGKSDRLPKPLGQPGLWESQPAGEVDVMPILRSDDYGDTLGARIRRLESCGFLIHKLEALNPEYGNNGAPMGLARIWIGTPVLEVTFHPIGHPQKVALPPATDVKKLAGRLCAAGGDGVPPTRVPENLAELARKQRAKARPMPDWMKKRVEEVAALLPRTRWYQHRSLYTRLREPDAGKRDVYLKHIDHLLSYPPAWFRGHGHLDPVIDLLDGGPMLPEVARYHLTRNVQLRWNPPYLKKDPRHQIGYSYYGSMGTLNHQSQYRAEALLAGEILGNTDLEVKAQRALSLLNRQMIFIGGACQEHGATFYLSISMGALKTVARYSRNPLYRLKADLAVEKLLMEINSDYHPGLRRRVSPVDRRYRVPLLVLGQDLPEAVLHTLSKRGTLIDADKNFVHGDPKVMAKYTPGTNIPKADREKVGIPVYCFSATSPGRVVNLAPWGRPWETHAIDDKPIPFQSFAKHGVRGIAREPIWYSTYMGRRYALSASHIDLAQEWTNVSAWSRVDRDVTTLDELGILFMWGYMNGKTLNLRAHAEGPYVKANPMMATLQHKGAMIHVIRPPSKGLAAADCKEGVRSFKCRASIYAYGPDSQRELYVGTRPVRRFPITAKHEDRITIDEGASYVGLIPLPPAGGKGTRQVEITYKYPRLNLDCYGLDLKQPMPNNDATWRQLMDVTTGWVVVLGDVTEYKSFNAFQKAVLTAELKTRWDPAKRVRHVACTLDKNRMELGFKTTRIRPSMNVVNPESAVIAYAKVNGRSPYPPDGIQLDTPLAQMGKLPLLEKGGAVLRTAEGQTAILKIEPITKTTVGINPFVDPTPFELTTPEGVIVKSDGPLGIARVTVQPMAGKLTVDYRLPPPGGDKGLELLQAGRGTKRFFRKGVDITKARQQSARALLITGQKGNLSVTLNGNPLDGPFQTVSRAGRTWVRIPIVVPE